MNILIISPEKWGEMRISKHHYAIALAQAGHNVKFLEPMNPGWQWSKSSFDSKTSATPNLEVVSQSLFFPYNLKFHLARFYDTLIKIHIRKIENNIGPFDLIWSFDIANGLPLKHFKKYTKSIFFAADWPPNKDSIHAPQGANLIVSVAQEILDQYPTPPNSKKLLVSHGVANPFIQASKKPFQPQSSRIKIGLSGNFLRPDINRLALQTIVNHHPQLHFSFFGAYESKESNLGGNDDIDTIHFIDSLRGKTNTQFHGILSQNDLANKLREMDAFLICYDESKDQSKGTNYHKISEYLAYDRFIVSNRVSAHASNPMIIQDADRDGKVDIIANFNAFIRQYSREFNPSAVKSLISYQDNLNSILSAL